MYFCHDKKNYQIQIREKINDKIVLYNDLKTNVDSLDPLVEISGHTDIHEKTEMQ